jgi:hypothetical protein
MNFHTFIHPCSEDQPPNCDVPRPQRSRSHGQLLRGVPELALRDYAALTYEALHSYLTQLLDRGAQLLVRVISALAGGGVGRCRRSKCTG